MRWRHPSRRRLADWLDGDGTSAVDEHVATCARCANRLEELAEPVPALTSALNQSLQAPDDLVARLGVRMSRSMRNREDLALFMELMGIPWRTVQNLMTEDDE